MKKLIIIILFSILSILHITTLFSNIDIPALIPKKAENGKWGYVDDKGCYRIKPQFETALPFTEGLASVSVYKKYAYIDEKGRPVIKPQFDGARSFSENLAAVMIIDQDFSKKWGYIDKTGKFAIQPLYDEVADFTGSTALVKLNGKSLTINKTGEIIYDN